MDSLMISLTGKTCGIGIHPTAGFFCVREQGTNGSPFGSDYMLVTAGFVISLTLVFPLGIMELVDNIKVQIASFMILLFTFISWLITFMVRGLNKDLVPIVGSDESRVVGAVLFNYAFITTVPSWINEINPTVSIRKSIWYSIAISTVLYVSLGIFGGMSFYMDPSSNIIAVINSSSQRSIVNNITTYLFPLAALISSIPVYTIIVRYNLTNDNFCNNITATLLSNFLPWIIIIPFQTGSWLNEFMNWTSLIFSTISNFIIPFWLYYISRNQKHLKSDEDIASKVVTSDDISVKAKNLERKLSLISDTISIKSVFLTLADEELSVRSKANDNSNLLSPPIVIRPPSPGVEQNTGYNHTDLRLSPSTTPRRRRSRDSTQSRIPKLDEKESNDDIVVVINTAISPKQTDSPIYCSSPIQLEPSVLSSSPKEFEPQTFLSVQVPQIQNPRHISGSDGGGNNDAGSPVCSTPATSTTTDLNQGRHLSARPSLMSRTSFGRKKSPSRPTIVITPPIYISDENNNISADAHCETHSLSINSVHSSPNTNCPPSPISMYEEFYAPSIQKSNVTSLSETDNNMGVNNKPGEVFKAIPWLSAENGLKLAVGCGCTAIIMIGGSLIYDFVALAMGNNVFG
ncbi:3028_t:CDS:2 [Acaulospora morrowiae]|uniref:3028_t:CDS:1 n=1 Tax=Acaulospora morrowiae TaxID=94023 RepID=A0A9N9HR29_9GLOM|nr:3028_t:CDS:2 [Acaulospora morrowiae]